ncbi:uncharacterized protein DUF4185 [Flavobacteriaceae bacterium MAR_2010_72]|nr:uncharacterized protein DUF4185 [Flavobacteriaceae bacterium MAR_2010_72]
MKKIEATYKHVIFCSTLLLLLFFLTSCNKNKKKVEITDDEEVAQREVTMSNFNKLVIVDSLGVTGADGIISFPLSDGSSVFMMGDSFLAKVENGKRDPDAKMINNTFVVVDKDQKTSKSIYQGELDDPETMLIPNNENREEKEFYWPGHGFEYENEIHLFMSRFIHIVPVDGGWNFEFKGTDYLKLEKDTYKIIEQTDFPYTQINNIHWGHSLLKEDNYTYIYGTFSDKKTAKMHVSRATMNAENKLHNFEFFDGKTWSDNAKKTVAMDGININTSEQFSVFKLEDKYVLLTQERDLFAGNIYSYISDSPVGPWRNEKLLFHATEQENTKDKIFTYNAMAHPQYVKDNMLLVSFCVNSFDVPSIHENVSYYRPRFIRVPLELILEE